MPRPSRDLKRAILALCVTLLCVAALGELSHDHRGGLLESPLSCASCALALVIVVLPPELALMTPPVSSPQWRGSPELVLPDGTPIGRPTARGPPSC